MNEAETRAELIDPALDGAGWSPDAIRPEYRITEGRHYLVGDEVLQREGQRADYLLMIDSLPIAVLEAKDEQHAPGAGLQQAKAYAELLDVPFAYSSNGHGFVEFDYRTHLEARFAMDAFPAPASLLQRWEETRRDRKTGEAGDPQLYPYWSDGRTYPRYYQDVAVRAAIDAVQQGRTRILLSMATGTGKTYIASQIAWKLFRTKMVRRILFLADRVNLRDQAYNAFGPFARATGGDPRAIIEEGVTLSRDIYFGIYQGLYGEGEDGQRTFERFPPDFFDLVIVDECHRSGFGTWRDILDYFGGAIQLGLTATPKRTDNIDTYAYFGDPVFEYSLGQGIDDGYLATYKVHRVRTNLDPAGGVSVRDAVIAGAELFVPPGVDEPRDFYSIGQFERAISLPDWTRTITSHLASLLESTSPLDRTIVFCASMDQALDVRAQLQNQFAHLGFDDYAVRIVSEERDGLLLLERFRDSTRPSPVIATTVDLLTTGVDVPSVRNVVFMRPVGSVVAFKQMVGRGTRLDPSTGKLWFRVIDYVNASRLFDEWDRPPQGGAGELPPEPWRGELLIEVVDGETAERIDDATAVAIAAPNRQIVAEGTETGLLLRGLPERNLPVSVAASGYRSRTVTILARAANDAAPIRVELRTSRATAPPVRLTGLTIEIAGEMVLTVDSTGHHLTVSEYYDYVRQVILDRAPTVEDLRAVWIDRSARREFLDDLAHLGVHPDLLLELHALPDADSYDLMSSLAFGGQPRLRPERAEAFLNRHSAWLDQFDEEQRGIVLLLLDAYQAGGVAELDERRVLTLRPFTQYGGVVGVVRRFGSTERVDEILRRIQAGLYEAEAA